MAVGREEPLFEMEMVHKAFGGTEAQRHEGTEGRSPEAAYDGQGDKETGRQGEGNAGETVEGGIWVIGGGDGEGEIEGVEDKAMGTGQVANKMVGFGRRVRSICQHSTTEDRSNEACAPSCFRSFWSPSSSPCSRSSCIRGGKHHGLGGSATGHYLGGGAGRPFSSSGTVACSRFRNISRVLSEKFQGSPACLRFENSSSLSREIVLSDRMSNFASVSMPAGE